MLNKRNLCLTPSKNLLLFEGDTFNWECNSAYGDVCVKCLRTSTSQYHIYVQLVLLEFDKVIHRQYGQSLKGLTSANLCNSCHRYVLQNSISFNDAWPSILSTYWKKSNANHEILKKLLNCYLFLF